MNDIWLTIKAWFKALLFLAIISYSAIFVYKNNKVDVQFWWWFKQPQQTSVFLLSSGAFLTGIIFTVIFRTTWKTWRQITELRGRSRTGKLEREMADMKAKAAMLQTRPLSTESVTVKVDKLGTGPTTPDNPTPG